MSICCLCGRGESGDIAVLDDYIVSGLGEYVVYERLLGGGNRLAGNEHDGPLYGVSSANYVLLAGLNAVNLHGEKHLLLGVGLVVGAKARIAYAPGVAGDVGGKLGH